MVTEATGLLTSAEAEWDDDEGDWDEREELPADLAGLEPDALKRTALFRAAWMILLGTALIFAFSDPMVDILAYLGDLLGIGSFYAAFILTPVIANGNYDFPLGVVRANITSLLPIPDSS